LFCDDGATRPVVYGKMFAHDGEPKAVEFLVDIDADRTVLCAATVKERRLSAQPAPSLRHHS
jgi:hypothetical protein